MSNSYDEFRNKYRVVNNTNNNKRNVKNRPSRTRFNVRVAAGLAAGLLAIGGLAACKEEDKTKNVNQPSTVTYSSTLTGEEKLENSVRKAEQDFLKRYLEGYNKENNTDYMAYEAELVTNSLNQGIVYVVDDKLVTCGRFPELVKTELSKYGNVTTEDGHDKVMQILINREEDTIVLGTYDSKTLEAMYSGTQIDDLDNLNDKLFELEDLGISEELSEAMAELSAAKGNESEDSIKQRVDKYNKAVELEDKGYEIGD